MDAPHNFDIHLSRTESAVKSLKLKSPEGVALKDEVLAKIDILREQLKATRYSAVEREFVARMLEQAYRDAAEPPARLVMPPRFWWDMVGRLFMSPAGLKLWCEPHIADMHEQYFKCISRGDEWGARRVVIWAHIYAVPSWLWGALMQVLLRLVHWIRA